MVEHEKTCHNRKEGLVEKMTRGEDGKYYVTCSKCQQRFERTNAYKRHEAKCTGIKFEKRKQYRYKCFECERKFVTKIACADHLAKIHNFFVDNVEKFCFECKAEFDDIFTHTKSHNCPFQCQQVKSQLLLS